MSARVVSMKPSEGSRPVKACCLIASPSAPTTAELLLTFVGDRPLGACPHSGFTLTHRSFPAQGSDQGLSENSPQPRSTPGSRDSPAASRQATAPAPPEGGS